MTSRPRVRHKDPDHHRHPDVFVVEIIWAERTRGLDSNYEVPFVFRGRSFIYSTRFEITGAFQRRKTERIRVDAVRPIDPFPLGLGRDAQRELNIWIKKEIEAQYPGWSVVDFSMDKIDLETPIHERAALKEELWN